MNILRRETLGDELYELLSLRILAEAELGHRLIQGRLVADMSVSRIPVRNAVRRLAADGRVVGDELGHSTILSLEADDAREIYAIRRRLEPLAISLAVAHIDSETFEGIESLLGEMDEAAHADQPAEYVNTRFHQAIYEASYDARLMTMIQTVWSGVPGLTPFTLRSHKYNSLAKQGGVVGLLVARDPAGAGAAFEWTSETPSKNWWPSSTNIPYWRNLLHVEGERSRHGSA